MIDFDKVADESRASIEKADLKVLLPIIAAIKPQKVLEIGTWRGYSAEVWYKAFDLAHYPTYLVSVEYNKEDWDMANAYKQEKMNYWPNFIFGDSHKDYILKMVKDISQTYDFLFIDGDHSYEGVKQDFEMYSPLVRKGGIIVLHDVVYTSDDPAAPVQVKRLWDELRDRYDSIEIKESENSTGIGVLFV